jgi:hypothetical protein
MNSNTNKKIQFKKNLNKPNFYKGKCPGNFARIWSFLQKIDFSQRQMEIFRKNAIYTKESSTKIWSDTSQIYSVILSPKYDIFSPTICNLVRHLYGGFFLSATFN